MGKAGDTHVLVTAWCVWVDKIVRLCFKYPIEDLGYIVSYEFLVASISSRQMNGTIGDSSMNLAPGSFRCRGRGALQIARRSAERSGSSPPALPFPWAEWDDQPRGSHPTLHYNPGERLRAGFKGFCYTNGRTVGGCHPKC